MKRKILIFFVIGVALFEAYSLFPLFLYKGNNLPGSIILQDRNGIEITNKANKFGYSLPRNDTTKEIYESKFVEKLILIEDKQFKSHFGINLKAKLRAVKDNIVTLGVSSGGSTLTEQYIKNKYFPFEKRSILQKLREANDSFLMSLFIKKEDIIADYLDTIYFGDNIWGFYGAIDKYFGKKSILDLNDEEINILLTKVRLPGVDFASSRFVKYFEKVKKRAGLEYDKKYYILNPKKDYNLFPFVTNLVTLDERFINKRLTIDKELQDKAEKTVFGITEILKEKNVTGGATIGVKPYTSEILFYVGGKNFEESQVDLVKAKNLVGSTLKPFLYLMAMEKGASPDSYLIDFRANISDSKEGTHYISRNYNLKEYGTIRLKEALGNSLNNPAIRLIDYLGIEDFYNKVSSAGANFNAPHQELGPGIVLGTAELSLDNLVTTYISLLPDLESKKGRKLKIFYEKNVKKEQKNDAKSEKIMLKKILENPNNRAISFGATSILNTSIPQAVKTGTSNDFRDNLVVSYGKDLVVGVWVGDIDNKPMKGVTGITGAGKIWHNIIEKAISLGYITEEENYYNNDEIEEYYACLDSDCYMKERSIKRKNETFYSYDRENIVNERDFFIKPTEEEKIKLEVSGFRLKSQY